MKSYLPAAVWLLIITYLSVTPSLHLPRFELISADKLGHAAAYALLAGLILWAIIRERGRSANNPEQRVVFLIAGGYGIFMEWVQGTFFPYRSFEYDDMIANAAGAFLAIMTYRLFRKQTQAPK